MAFNARLNFNSQSTNANEPHQLDRATAYSVDQDPALEIKSAGTALWRIVWNSGTNKFRVTVGEWAASVIGPAYLGTGTRDGTNFLRDDGTWQSAAQSFSGARAYRSGSDQTITSPNTDVVQLNSESYDVGAAFDSATNYRFQPTTAGYYRVFAQVTPAGGSNSSPILYIYKNGAATAESKGQLTSLYDTAIVVSDVVNLNGTTDYVDIRCSYDIYNNASTVLKLGSTKTYATFEKVGG